jgi:Fe-S cluster biogenesis protein NfuA
MTEQIETAANPVSVGISSRADDRGVAAPEGPIDEAERAGRQAALDKLIQLMRPAVQADGGDVEVTDVDFDAGIVEVQLQGACGSCAISSVTLQGGVERLLRERLPWVTEVRGSVDDSIDSFESASMGRGGYVPR